MSNRKTTISEKVQERIVVDGATGEVITSTTTKESHMLARNPEPDYIKLYTKMWCEFNEIPQHVRPLFWELALRMTYCNSTNLEESQIVYTSGPNQKAMMRGAGITNTKVFYRHLQTLTECGAIKKITRGCYQINPQYAGRGSWRFNAKEGQGGIEDLVATFRFKDRTVETSVVYADDSKNELLGLRENEQIVARKTVSKPIPFDGSFKEDEESA